MTRNAIASDKPIQVTFGGSGVATATAFSVLCGGTTGTSPFQSVATLGSAGQVLTSNGAGVLPTWQAGGGGGGGTGGGFTWSVIVASPVTTAGNGYITNGGGNVSITLPIVSSVGDAIRVVDYGGNGWSINQNAGNFIKIATYSTTVGAGGSLDSNDVGDEVTLVCVTANTAWIAIDVVGNITYV